MCTRGHARNDSELCVCRVNPTGIHVGQRGCCFFLSENMGRISLQESLLNHLLQDSVDVFTDLKCTEVTCLKLPPVDRFGTFFKNLGA